MPVKLEPHEWLRERREDKGIRQSDVQDRTAEFGPRHRISQSHLSKIEKGRAPLAGLGPERMDALRQVLGLTPEEWVEGTGFQIVTAPEEAEEASSPTSLPDALAQAIELHARRFPDLLDPAWQRYLAGFRWRHGEPDDPEAWLDLYRDLARAGIVPGGN